MTQLPNTPAASRKREKFSPHGIAEFWCEGRRLMGIAEGPFNLEMARYIEQQIVEWCSRMRADGPFDHLCEFRTSVLLGPEPMRHFYSMLERLSKDGIGPRRMAYVVGPDVEGGSLLAPQLTKAYASAGQNMRVFTTRDAALEWLDS